MRTAFVEVVGVLAGAGTVLSVAVMLPGHQSSLIALGIVVGIGVTCLVKLARLGWRSRRRAQGQRLADEVEQYLSQRRDE